MDFKVTIHRLLLREEKLEIAVSASGPWDEKVRDPKMTIVFSNGEQTRRLPIVVRFYQAEKDGSFYIMASYSYMLKHLFYQQPKNRHIEFSLELSYGHTVLESVPFTVDPEDEKALELLVRETAVGVEESEQERQTYIEYEMNFSKDSRKVILDAKPGQEKIFEIHKGRKIFNSIIMWLWHFVLFCVSVVLIPVFFIDALLAATGCQSKNAKIPENGIIYLLKHVRAKMDTFSRTRIGILAAKMWMMNKVNLIARWMPVKKNRVVFLSNRRDDLTGNFEFVNRYLDKVPGLDRRYVLDSNDVKHMRLGSLIRMAWYFGNSKVILVDDFCELFFRMPRREGTYLIQLWHACGAFKTFGCSRLGRPGGQTQKSKNHRNYDYALVSSHNIAKFYAEGFGISEDKVAATGIPRTDVFFDEKYKKSVVTAFYDQYPKLKNKKILLFAPTFRGNGKLSGYYPVDRLDVNKLYEDLNEEYAIIVKHHPFVNNRSHIRPKYADYIIDLSANSELNDLLFVTDLLITDYSSVVFEASLLDIPMLLYAYDLDRYISSRGFYYEYEDMAPGKIVRTYSDLVDSIEAGDFENDKLLEFKKRFFDDLDGRSTDRTGELIVSCLNK
ncbi:MAG: CDP-glycerol glycerophosphotransferase family protein [Lachnospiraceae bacterium]|nr:CDP-glycerol glycerophosphotransferase family protein [Lachnospiraceae bacterium]